VRIIQSAYWSGNVRELANSLERAAILADADILRGEDLVVSGPLAADGAGGVSGGGAAAQTMEDVEREAIRRALAAVGGNRRTAAEKLGIGVRTLYEKLKKYDLE